MFGHGMEKGPSIHLQGLRRMLTILGTSHLKTLPSQHILMLLAFQVFMEILLQLPHFLKVHYTSLSIRIGAGICNATGRIDAAANYDMTANPTGHLSGALYSTARPTAWTYSTAGSPTYVWSNELLDLSRSNPIYGNSNTVTPLSLSCTMLMKY